MMMAQPNTSGEKQGIVAILGSDCGAASRVGSRLGGGGAASLRRTLSADMSSKKWLAQNGFGYADSSPMKKIASSKDFSLNPVVDSPSSSEDEDEEENRFERVELIKKEFDIWSSIVSDKADQSSMALPPPYVHPLVKRSASSLSAKSLQICTESLGCETGSDGFSEASDSESEQPAETGQAEIVIAKKPTSPPPREVEEENNKAARLNQYSPARKTTSFPPPLPSLTSRCGEDGAPTLLMRSRRDNGRLVVEAVAVPTSQKNFAAQRRDGRLVLMFAPNTNAGEDLGEIEEQFGEDETETEYKDEQEQEQEQDYRAETVTETRLINFHRLALMADKRRNNPAAEWSKEMSKLGEEGAVAASLPPRPRGPVGRLIPAPAAAKVSTNAAASFNHYEYFWRSKFSSGGASNDGKFLENDKRQYVVLSGDSYLVSSLKGCCKEPRRSLIWEPRCIATS